MIKIDKMQKLIVITGVTLAVLAVTAVASSSTTNTPLYTLRMEQASNKMNFLPTAVNEFIYTAENGYQLNYGFTDDCCVAGSPDDTYELTCDYYKTCWDTCPRTCQGSTCTPTCPATCNDPTCPATCPVTCDDPTCPWTCDTCYQTCEEPTCVENTCFCLP